MKKIILLLLIGSMANIVAAQEIFYVASKIGLTMRENPDIASKPLDKILYGQAVQPITDSIVPKKILVEGFTGYWCKIKYNDKTGYVVNAYLLPFPPPGAGIKKLKDYFEQVSVVNGAAVVTGKEQALSPEQEDMRPQITKQLFKNGMEWQETSGYENSSSLYFLPGCSIEQAYLLLRLLNQYPQLIADKEFFPVKNSSVKKGGTERSIEITRGKYADGKMGPVEKIKIIYVEGAITELEIFTIDSQVLISWSSGV